MLVNTEAVIKARVTTGTSKYHASRGSLAAPSIVSAEVLLLYKERERLEVHRYQGRRISQSRHVLLIAARSDRPDRQSPLQTPT